jgi:hypothetical protein
MPNVSAHIGCALKVKKELGIDSDSFIYGALLPDILDMDKRKSHYKEQGTTYLVPNLDSYKKEFDLSNPLNCGYYFHLYLDYYFLEEYLEENNKGTDVFDGSTLYKDYDIINKKLVMHYDIDVDDIERILKKYSNKEVSDRKLNNNINCLRLSKDGEYVYLKEDKFIRFLDKTIDKFIKEMQ